jgi:hypothetical protein
LERFGQKHFRRYRPAGRKVKTFGRFAAVDKGSESLPELRHVLDALYVIKKVKSEIIGDWWVTGHLGKCSGMEHGAASVKFEDPG